MNSNFSAIVLRYHSLPQRTDYSMLRYIWLDGNGRDLRTKSNYMKSEPKSVEEVPLWCYCGYSCGHMKLVTNSECWLRPVLLCGDPFRKHTNKLVFCVPTKYEIPASTNRDPCESLFAKWDDSKIPTFTIRQSYIVLNASTKKPIGWPFDDYDSKNPDYKYGVGTNMVVGRDISEAFYKACLYAGLPISAIQTSDMPALWSFKIGPTRGIPIADQLWMARFILHYIGEQFNCVISFDSLKYDTSVETSLDVWIDGQTPHIPFPINTDPYIAIKAISESNN